MRSGRIAVLALVLLLAGGTWVFVAPFGLSLQPLAGPWTTATRNDLATGGAIMVAALAALAVYGALVVRELLAGAPQRRAAAIASGPMEAGHAGQEPLEPGPLAPEPVEPGPVEQARMEVGR